MAQKSRRGRRRGAAKDTPRPAMPQTANGNTNGSGDRYQKFLPEWMRGATAPARPARPRRGRQPRPAGGYTPGKMALQDHL